MILQSLLDGVRRIADLDEDELRQALAAAKVRAFAPGASIELKNMFEAVVDEIDRRGFVYEIAEGADAASVTLKRK